jgi:hypothetical protein
MSVPKLSIDLIRLEIHILYDEDKASLVGKITRVWQVV